MKGYFCTVFALLGSLLLTVSCGREGRQADVLSRLDSLVEADADSALRLMGRMQNDGWSRRDAMRLELLRAKAMNRADSLFTTDSLMLRVSRYYRRHGTRNERMLSLYLLGCTYRDMGSAPRAIETWQQAVAEADTNRQDCDLSTLMRIHSQMSFLFRMQRLSENEKQEMEKAEVLCWKMNDTLSAIAFEQASCNWLFNEGDYKGCIERAQYLYERYMDWGLPDKAAKVAVFCVKSYIKLSDYANAKKYLDIYESYCLSETDHRKINGGLAPYYIYKGNYYLGIGDIDSAEHCFRRAMPEMHMLHNDVDVYYRLYHIFEQRQQLDSTLKYVRFYALAKDNELGKLKIQATSDAKNLYDYSVEKKIANEEKEKTFSLILSLILLGFASLFLFCIGLFTWYHQRKKKELRIKTLELKLHASLSSLHSAEEQLAALMAERSCINAERAKIQRETSNLRDMLREKESQVLEEQGRNQSLVLEISEIEELLSKELSKGEQTKKDESKNLNSIEKIKKIIKEKEHAVEFLETLLQESDNSEKDKTLSESPALKPFRAYFQEGKRPLPTEQEWADLRQCIEQIYTTFYRRIHYNKKYNEEDYRICLLVKACFEPGQIEKLLKMPDNYASIRRKRLLTKIFGKEGGAEDFDNIILRIQ